MSVSSLSPVRPAWARHVSPNRSLLTSAPTLSTAASSSRSRHLSNLRRKGERLRTRDAGEEPQVPLAPISGPSLVASATARAVGVRETPGGQPLAERLKNYLREKHMLLLLDNFEHMVTAAPLEAELLEASPRLKVMVTQPDEPAPAGRASAPYSTPGAARPHAPTAS
jgi:hypothetical protein